MLSRRPTLARFNLAFKAARSAGLELGEIPAQANRFATDCGCSAGGLGGLLVLLAAPFAIYFADNHLRAAGMCGIAFLVASGVAKIGAIAVAHLRLLRLCRSVEAANAHPHFQQIGHSAFEGISV